jgi:hypothetical protein
MVSFTPWRLTPGERAPGTARTAGWVGPRNGVGGVEKGKISPLPRLELRPLDVHPVESRYTDSSQCSMSRYFSCETAF